ITHGGLATSWRLADCTPTGMAFDDDGFNLFAFAASRPIAALTNDQANRLARIALLDYDTGLVACTEPKAWNAIALAFSQGPWGEDLAVLSRGGILETIDVLARQSTGRTSVGERGLADARFSCNGRVLRLASWDSDANESARYIERADDGRWRD